MPQNPLELFKLANTKCICSASSIPSHGDHYKGSCPHSSLFLCLLTHMDSASLCGPLWYTILILMGSVSITNYAILIAIASP